MRPASAARSATRRSRWRSRTTPASSSPPRRATRRRTACTGPRPSRRGWARTGWWSAARRSPCPRSSRRPAATRRRWRRSPFRPRPADRQSACHSARSAAPARGTRAGTRTWAWGRGTRPPAPGSPRRPPSTRSGASSPRPPPSPSSAMRCRTCGASTSSCTGSSPTESPRRRAATRRPRAWASTCAPGWWTSRGACSRSSLHPDRRHEAHAPPGRATQVVGESELRLGDLPRPGLATELEPHLVHHAEPARPDRVAEALEPAVGVHRLRALAVEAAVQHVLPRLAARREAHVLHEDELRRREAVVHLGHADLGARVLHARLLVGVPRAGDHLGEGREVVVLAVVALRRPRREGERLDEYRILRVAVRVLGPAEDRRRRAVAHAGAVEDAEHAGDRGRLADGLDRHLFAELGLRVLRSVLVVLPRDAGEDLLERALLDAVLLGIRRGEQGERGRRGHVRERAVVGRVRADQPRDARVLELLDADRHH